MYRNKTARQHNFATVPRADIPRSKFAMRQTRKQAFNASELIPIMCEEVLPGDTWSHREHVLARLATPIAPLIDDLDLETFYFFVPNRILIGEWWENFITGQPRPESHDTEMPNVYPTDETTFPPTSQDINVNSVFDHFGIPPGTYTYAGGPSFSINALPFLGYFTIFNEWFRDQNLQTAWEWPRLLDGSTDAIWTNEFVQRPDGASVTARWTGEPLRLNKRHDYFTSSLPWPQKGPAIELPLGTTAPVSITGNMTNPGVTNVPTFLNLGTLIAPVSSTVINASNPGLPTQVEWQASAASTGLVGIADLASATAVTINTMRLAFQTQKLLERDARGGSRYVEQLLSHFGVKSPDYRLQRPEYLGGSKIPIVINPIAQTAAYTAEPGAEESAVGNLGAEMHASGSNKTFNYSATEHGYIIGLCAVRATPTYQQGLRRHWKRAQRLDFYFPAFCMLGEQSVHTREIFNTLTQTWTNNTWGFQEAWAEYRYTPNEITGVLRSTAAQPLDWWHLSEEFATEPALNAAFITDKTQETLSRSLATAPSEQWSAQIIMDILHDSQVGRLMPTYSVPGLIDHF